MSSPFFEDGWEEETQGVLITARARAAAFIEATTDNRLKMQLKSVLDALIPCQDAIRLLSAFLLVSFMEAGELHCSVACTRLVKAS